MKKIIYTLVLIVSIKGATFGQKTLDRKTFEFPDRQFHTRFLIDLGKGNKVQLDLADQKDLARLPDVDSLLRVFLQDMVSFKDSLSDELTQKRIDYQVDSSGRKKIRIRQSRPDASSYVMDKGQLAALKLDQDTVYILSGFYRISIFINRLSELPALLNGTIDGKINTLKQGNDQKDWVRDEKDERVHLRTDPAISARLPGGNRLQPNDMLESLAAVSIQNYKTYFVPSFDLGAALVLNNFDWKKNNSRFKYVLEGYWEPQFLFQSTPGGLKTYRNDFITFSFGYGLKDTSLSKKSPLRFNFSVGYLVGNRGGFYAPHTFRVGLDEISVFDDNVKIQPVVYFNNFFKGVTPGLRITRNF